MKWSDVVVKYWVLLIPVTFTVFAVTGCGFFFRAGVSASCAVILWMFPEQSVGRSIRWVFASLLVSIPADWFMMHSNTAHENLIYGICLFFLAHVGFLLFCLKNGGIHWRFLLPVLAGYLVFFFTVLRPAIGQSALFVVALAYLLVSCFSLAAAIGLRLPAMIHGCFAAGIALLVFSDTIIALKIFAGYREFGFLILPTYFASHIMVTLALMR